MSYINKPGDHTHEKPELPEPEPEIKFAELDGKFAASDDIITTRNFVRKRLARNLFKNVREFFGHWNGTDVGGNLAKVDISIRGEELSLFLVFNDKTSSTFTFGPGDDEPTYVHHSDATQFNDSMRWWVKRISERNGGERDSF